MKKDIEITLKKDGSNDIIIKCPQKIKLHPVAARFALSCRLPLAKINPVQGKDVIKSIGLFFSMFIACILFVVPQLGVIALAGVVALNVIYNKNYFFNFIKKKMEEGYKVEDEEQRNLLQDAGLQTRKGRFF